MDKRESFKLGFFMKIAECGMTPEQFMEKLAFGEGMGLGGHAWKLATLIALLGAAVPAGIGYAGGTIAAKVKEPDAYDVHEDNVRTLRDKYQNLAEQAKAIHKKPEEATLEPSRGLMRSTAL